MIPQPARTAILPNAPVIGASAAPAIAAGQDEGVPRLFLVLLDGLALGLAFLVTVPLAPWVQHLLLQSGPLHLTLPAWLQVPAAPVQAFPDWASVGWLLGAMTPSTILFVEALGGYAPLLDQSRARVVASSIVAPLLALSLVTLGVFALKLYGSSRVLIFTFGATSVVALLGYRSALWLYKVRRLAAGAYAKNVLVIGPSSAAAWMVGYFRDAMPKNRFRVCGWLRVQPDTAPTDVDAPCLAGVDGLASVLVHQPIHEVVAVQAGADRDWLVGVIEQCDFYRVRLHIVPEALLMGSLRDVQLVFRAGFLRLPEVVLSPPHLDSDALFAKRLLDVLISASLLLLLSPLFVLIAIAIKLTTPELPIFYPWRVIGLKGRPFIGYKFTTMVADAERQWGGLVDRNEMSGPVFKIRDDPRVTTLGRCLRKYSLNELPQLWSVLKGDMSLVGPRPAFRHELDRYQLWHKRRLCVKPGITCLWQVSGRNAIRDFDDWVRLDLEYMDQWSVWLDLRILVRTVAVVLAGTGS